MSFEFKPLLTPPGGGVFTVNTAKEKKASLHQKLYGSAEADVVNRAFAESLNDLSLLPLEKVALLGVCSDCGGGIMRGANWGPLFIRERLYQGSLATRLTELGDVRVIPHLLHDKYLNDPTIEGCQKALFGEVNQLPVSPLSMTETLLDDCYQAISQFRLLALGGDHSVSYPLVGSYLKAKQAQGVKVALIHFDAHTDLLVDRLGIDICFGSWLTHVLPGLEKPGHAIQLGIRSSGKDKTHWQQTFGVQQYWASEIKAQTIETVVDSIKQYLQQEAIDELYISFDIDALDAAVAASTGTPEPDGLSLDECLYAITELSQTVPLSGADLVEVAPMIGDQQAQETTLAAAGQIAEALISGMISG